jgi:hypothetical protein
MVGTRDSTSCARPRTVENARWRQGGSPSDTHDGGSMLRLTPMPSTRTRAKMEDPFHLLPTATLANKHLDGIIVGTHELNLVKWNIFPSATYAKPVCKTANNGVRGSITWFGKDKGVICATLNLRGAAPLLSNLWGLYRLLSTSATGYPGSPWGSAYCAHYASFFFCKSTSCLILFPKCSFQNYLNFLCGICCRTLHDHYLGYIRFVLGENYGRGNNENNNGFGCQHRSMNIAPSGVAEIGVVRVRRAQCNQASNKKKGAISCFSPRSLSYSCACWTILRC